MPITLSLHLKMLISVAMVVIGTMWWGKVARREGRLPVVSRQFGAGLLVLWIFYNAYYFYPANFNWHVSLPLHVCDVLGVVAGGALISSQRIWRTFLYFSALALATQAIITPTGNQDPVTLRFWLYWALHAGIIASSLFDLIIRSYRPTAKDLVSVLILDAAYVLIVLPIDVLFGWNYGYLGNATPEGTTIIDVLGPWPQRVFFILAIVIAMQMLMFLPWAIRNHLHNASNRHTKVE